MDALARADTVYGSMEDGRWLLAVLVERRGKAAASCLPTGLGLARPYRRPSRPARGVCLFLCTTARGEAQTQSTRDGSVMGWDERRQRGDSLGGTIGLDQ